jgi:putative lipoic acid-binding regulatory protein
VEVKAVISLDDKELEIIYPCEWSYKVIIDAKEEIGIISACVLGDREHSCKKSNNSKSGKYKSYKIDILVFNDDDRHEIFREFKSHNSVKMVL